MTRAQCWTLSALATLFVLPPILAQDPASCPLHGTPGHQTGEQPTPAAAEADQRSPYVELQQRDIKALGEAEIRQLLAGEGMGLALPAELHGYPGPKHLLELAGDLELTAEQRTSIQASFDRMHQRAVELGQEIVEGERALDRKWAAGSIEYESLATFTAALARLRGELRAAHLSAHLEASDLLAPEQIARYRRQRGYAGTSGRHRHQ